MGPPEIFKPYMENKETITDQSNDIRNVTEKIDKTYVDVENINLSISIIKEQFYDFKNSIELKIDLIKNLIKNEETKYTDLQDN